MIDIRMFLIDLTQINKHLLNKIIFIIKVFYNLDKYLYRFYQIFFIISFPFRYLH